jgi:hypothetical protein
MLPHFLIGMQNVLILRVTFYYCYTECHYAECRGDEKHAVFLFSDNLPFLGWIVLELVLHGGQNFFG